MSALRPTWDSTVEWIALLNEQTTKKMFLHCEHGGHLIKTDFHLLVSFAANSAAAAVSEDRAGVETAGFVINGSGVSLSGTSDSGAWVGAGVRAGVGTAVIGITGSGAAVSGVSHSESSHSGATDFGAGAGFGVEIGTASSGAADS